MTGPTLQSIFSKIDLDRDGRASRAEVQSAVKAAGVGSGLFGGVKVQMTTDEAMKQIDSNQDGFLSFDEVKAKIVSLFVASGSPPPGKIVEQAGQWFDSADTDHSGQVSFDEAKSAIQAQLTAHGQDQADTKAEIAADLALYFLDQNGNHVVDRDEMTSIAQDVDRTVHGTSVA